MGTFRHMVIVAFVCLLHELCMLLSVSLIQYLQLRKSDPSDTGCADILEVL